ncbi:E3 SUMO-protein ligase pli1 [Marasmius sp. AFHP31]|nr:E3 SUMO-protein ligase pli1 [Marasmius sp. AFHP31]
MAGQDPWSDFDTQRHSIKFGNTVDKLKQILQGLNEECGVHITKSGKKQDIIDKIVNQFDNWKHSNMVDRWNKAKVVLEQVRTTGTYTPGRASGSSIQAASSSMNSGNFASTSYTKGSFNSPTTPRFDPYNRRNSTVLSPTTSSSSISKPPAASARTAIQWKESPFFQVDQAVSTLVECPETTSATDRKQQTVTFTLNAEQVDKLKKPGSKYQLRLFCTSSTFWLNNASFRTQHAPSQPCPIEFPPTCEVRVNNVVLTASLKGLKKKAGTAPPPDLGKYVRVSTTQNRIEMVYVNSQQPTQPKKFYLIVMLVETTSVDTLVQNLKQTRYRSSSEVLRQMQANVPEDDDIIAGPQKMSLKCPLSFMRINTPSRSEKCTHHQCFDATSWFSVMEQTTTYLCPICERILSWKDLIIDGSFDDILKACPDSVEDVMVEADGEWHTNDNKYGSKNWKMKHPTTRPAKVASPSQTPSVVKTEAYDLPLSHKAETEKKPSDDVIDLYTDDEDEEGMVKQQLSPSSGNGTTSKSSRPPIAQEDVIDLTLDSDEEEAPPKQPGKRKASDAALSPTESIWKKSRTDGDHTNPYRTSNGANNRDFTRQRSPQRYSYNSSTIPLTYNRNQTSDSGHSVNGSSYSSSRAHWQ